MSRDLGDFQTPPGLVALVYQALTKIYGKPWQRLLEPTCGEGRFIREGLKNFSQLQDVLGIELQSDYVALARNIIVGGRRPQIINGSVFDLGTALRLSWRSSGPLLVVGNPPWVTNSELGQLGSDNLPRKSNFKRVKGIDAVTGSANFDIAEFIWLILLQAFLAEQATVAMLCKTTVARNVLRHAYKERWPVGEAALWRIDSQEWFGASADACLFAVRTSVAPSYQAAVYEDLGSDEPESIMGFEDGRLVPDLESYASIRHLVGECHLTWRQGIKHDAAAVMELTKDGSNWLNGLGEEVHIEQEYVFPLLKSSDIANGRLDPIERAVVVPQRVIGENTHQLATVAPNLWMYLSSHQDAFLKRRSTIYKDKPPFSVFGVGPYTFADHKIVTSGLYKKVRFVNVGPYLGKPILVDDTCYLLPASSHEQGELLTFALNHELVTKLINGLTFWDAKRPVTKSLLSQIDLFLVLNAIPPQNFEAHGFKSQLVTEVISDLGEHRLEDQMLPI